MILLRSDEPAIGFDGETGRGFVLPDAATPAEGAEKAKPSDFDPQGFLADLIDAGYRVSAARSMPDHPGDVWTPSLRIEPPPGRGFRRDYAEIMRKWSAAIDACPDYLDRTVAYVFG